MNPSASDADRLIPTKSDRVVVLMPSFGDCPTRLENQEYVIAWYASRGIPTVVGTDERGRRSGWFSRARAINRAARTATRTHPDRDVFVLCDNDLTPDPSPFLAALSTVDEHSAVMPHAHTLLTTPAGRKEVFHRGWTDKYESVGQGSRSFVVMTRDAFAAVNGMDERFEGWGPEDLAFRLSITRQLRPPFEMDGRRLHLWHPTDPSKRDMRRLMENRRRKALYQRGTKEQAARLAREYGRWNDGA